MFKNYTLDILYKDDFLVCINKPTALLVHKSMIDKNEIYFAMKILRDQIGQWVYPVHRLDKPTSGVLLFALDKKTARLLNEQFREHSIKKTYLCIVRGYTDTYGVINHPLKEKLDKIADKKATKDKEAQNAVSEYETLAHTELDYGIGLYDKTRYSLVKVMPKHGRKHQIRRHMKHISHHILGDTKYGRGEHNKSIRQRYECHRLLLHALSLEIQHPYTLEKLTFKAPLDEKFQFMVDNFFQK
ncbi:MAG: tRNA pseudouridine(65) synthase TruC [Epsilonproteobacteria bacterium]|nr:tRNA pseudouridine(65) synthase TruC [Campylobacterota bacterium]